MNNLQEFNALPLKKLYQIRELVQRRIDELEEKAKKAERVEQAQDYLRSWYSLGFNYKEDEDDDLCNWFCKYADPNDFELHKFYYVGKRSTHVRGAQTNYLERIGACYYSVEGGDWWEYRNKNSNLWDILKPPTQAQLLSEFFQINKAGPDEEFLEKLTRYLHCEGWREMLYDDGPFIIYDGHASDMDY